MMLRKNPNKLFGQPNVYYIFYTYYIYCVCVCVYIYIYSI